MLQYILWDLAPGSRSVEDQCNNLVKTYREVNTSECSTFVLKRQKNSSLNEFLIKAFLDSLSDSEKKKKTIEII